MYQLGLCFLSFLCCRKEVPHHASPIRVEPNALKHSFSAMGHSYGQLLSIELGIAPIKFPTLDGQS